MNSFVKGYANGYRDSQAKVDGSLSAFEARALSGVQSERDKYRAEALAWRALYEELKPFILIPRGTESLIQQADTLLREARDR